MRPAPAREGGSAFWGLQKILEKYLPYTQFESLPDTFCDSASLSLFLSSLIMNGALIFSLKKKHLALFSSGTA